LLKKTLSLGEPQRKHCNTAAGVSNAGLFRHCGSLRFGAYGQKHEPKSEYNPNYPIEQLLFHHEAAASVRNTRAG